MSTAQKVKAFLRSLNTHLVANVGTAMATIGGTAMLSHDWRIEAGGALIAGIGTLMARYGRPETVPADSSQKS